MKLILERQLKMNHNGYFAVKLDESWQDVIKKNATMDVVRGDHITLAYKPDDIAFSRYTKLVGKRVNVYIDEYRKNENIEAFFVTDMFYDSYRLTESEKVLKRWDDGPAHITVSHIKGLKPKEANTMFTNPTYKRQAIGYVEGTIEWIEFNNQETT
jgi:allophanate hydrolase subunit 1